MNIKKEIVVTKQGGEDSYYQKESEVMSDLSDMSDLSIYSGCSAPPRKGISLNSHDYDDEGESSSYHKRLIFYQK